MIVEDRSMKSASGIEQLQNLDTVAIAIVDRGVILDRSVPYGKMPVPRERVTTERDGFC